MYLRTQKKKSTSIPLASLDAHAIFIRQCCCFTSSTFNSLYARSAILHAPSNHVHGDRKYPLVSPVNLCLQKFQPLPISIYKKKKRSALGTTMKGTHRIKDHLSQKDQATRYRCRLTVTNESHFLAWVAKHFLLLKTRCKHVTMQLSARKIRY